MLSDHPAFTDWLDPELVVMAMSVTQQVSVILFLMPFLAGNLGLSQITYTNWVYSVLKCHVRLNMTFIKSAILFPGNKKT